MLILLISNVHKKRYIAFAIYTPLMEGEAVLFNLGFETFLN